MVTRGPIILLFNAEHAPDGSLVYAQQLFGSVMLTVQFCPEAGACERGGFQSRRSSGLPALQHRDPRDMDLVHEQPAHDNAFRSDSSCRLDGGGSGEISTAIIPRLAAIQREHRWTSYLVTAPQLCIG